MQPDVIVLAPDTPHVALIAEIKGDLRPGDRETLSNEIRRYMLDYRCDFALLVTPSKTWIFRDTLRDFSVDSIVEEGEFETAQVLNLDAAPTGEHDLYRAVLGWLERLASGWPSALPTAKAPRVPVAEYLAPAVAEGRILSGSV